MNRSKSAVLALVCGVGASLLVGCSATGSEAEPVTGEEEALGSSYTCPAGVPAALKPDADQTIKGALNGVGVQIYMCTGTSAGATAWTFVAPQANLLTDSGNLVGTHFIGPSWQGNDGSLVTASKLAGVSVDAAHLPWLLLKATAADESGIFDDITSIQRLATVGGNAPTTGCDAEHLGSIVQVPYSAEYVFYKKKTHGKVKQCSGS
jgi:hypothetical protein